MQFPDDKCTEHKNHSLTNHRYALYLLIIFFFFWFAACVCMCVCITKEWVDRVVYRRCFRANMHTSSSTFFMQKNQCECIIVSFFYSLLFCCLAQHWTQQQSSKCIFAYLFPLRLSSYFVFSAFAFIVALKASFSVDSMLSFSVYLLPIVGNIIFLLDFCYCLHKMRVFFFLFWGWTLIPQSDHPKKRNQQQQHQHRTRGTKWNKVCLMA